MNKPRKLAITGANGYLGQNAIREAIKYGWEVNAIVRREDVEELVRKLGANVFMIKTFNVEQYKEAFTGCKAVLHFANIVCGSKELFESVNVEGIKKIIKAAKQANVSRIIYPSGLGVDKYGEVEWADNEYFHSKRKAEIELINGRVPYIIFRPSYILGPKDELIPELVQQIGDGIVKITGDGKVPMQPIFVNDAMKAFLAAAGGKGKDNAIYSLVGLETANMVDIVERVFEMIKEIGLNIPPPRFEYISYEQAPEILEICEEMVDVMKCDLLMDGRITAKALGFQISPLNDAIRAAVTAELSSEADSYDKKAIILLSGGIDSATALFWALKEGYKVKAISFNYKWRPKQEKISTLKIAEYAEVELIEIPLPYLQQATDLRLEGYPIPLATNAPEGFIPLRNLIFYSIATYFAEIYGYNYVIAGHIKEDTIVFPDTTRSYFTDLLNLIKKSKHKLDSQTIEFIFPLVEMNKVEIINLALKLKVPIDLTWSCYGDFDKPCGLCKSCQKRNKAFQELNMHNNKGNKLW
ncbi:MAG: 7-cyano-7-deazaguanine synthase [Promethearchaeota archaeon]